MLTHFFFFRSVTEDCATGGQLPNAPSLPQFRPTHANSTVRASARTYFYETEKKCDDVMKNFLSCVNTAGNT